MAYLLFTSGSTARSKAVPLLHEGLVRNMHGIGERLHLTEQDRLLMVVSLFWSFGCANALFAMITHGGSVVLQDSFDTARSLELIERERCTVLYAMPNMALAMQAHSDRAHRDLSSLRTGITMPQSVKLMASIGVYEMTSCYGLTEGYGNSMVTDCKAPLEVRARISGTALPNTEVEIVDPATRRRLVTGETGEVRIRGFVTPGYYKDEATTRAATDDAGWFYTGDLATLDEAGGLRFVSRIKELVKTGGINVAPAEVEEILQAHPAVRQAVVVGLPDPEREEILAALVVLRDRTSATPEELIRHCRAQAAAFKVPRRIVLVAQSEVPLTDTGKISKRGVQDLLSARDHTV
jgi:fatty-acyl-CoA synthase